MVAADRNTVHRRLQRLRASAMFAKANEEEKQILEIRVCLEVRQQRLVLTAVLYLCILMSLVTSITQGTHASVQVKRSGGLHASICEGMARRSHTLSSVPMMILQPDRWSNRGIRRNVLIGCRLKSRS